MANGGGCRCGHSLLGLHSLIASAARRPRGNLSFGEFRHLEVPWQPVVICPGDSSVESPLRILSALGYIAADETTLPGQLVINDAAHEENNAFT